MASAVTIRGFDYMTKRLMPTRENLRRVHRGAAMSEEDIAGVELMLYLIRSCRRGARIGLFGPPGAGAFRREVRASDDALRCGRPRACRWASQAHRRLRSDHLRHGDPHAAGREPPSSPRSSRRPTPVAGSSNSPTRAGRSSRLSFPRISPEWPTSRNACRAMSASQMIDMLKKLVADD